MSTTTPARKVFETPELLTLICGYITDSRKLYPVLRTSRLGFYAAVRFVWKDIDVVNLLALLPGVKFGRGARTRTLKSIVGCFSDRLQ